MKRNTDEIFTKLQCQFFYALSSEPQVTVGERERKREKCKQFRTIFYVNKTERWSRGKTCAKENIYRQFTPHSSTADADQETRKSKST